MTLVHAEVERNTRIVVERISSIKDYGFVNKAKEFVEMLSLVVAFLLFTFGFCRNLIDFYKIIELKAEIWYNTNVRRTERRLLWKIIQMEIL